MTPPRSPRRPTARRAAAPQGGTRSLGDWLNVAPGALKALHAGASAAGQTLEAARGVLPAELTSHLWAASCVGSELVLVFESAAWATRARYQSEEWRLPLAAALGLTVDRVKVKVRPRG